MFSSCIIDSNTAAIWTVVKLSFFYFTVSLQTVLNFICGDKIYAAEIKYEVTEFNPKEIELA